MRRSATRPSCSHGSASASGSPTGCSPRAFASMLASGAFIGGIGPLDHHGLLLVHLGSAVSPHRRPGGAAGRASQSPAAGADSARSRSLQRHGQALAAIWPRARTWSEGSCLRQDASTAARRSMRGSCCWPCSCCTSRAPASSDRYTSIVGPIRFLGAFHGLAAGAAAVLVAGHVYLAVIHPATRHALRGITLGSVRRDWAEQHHAEWVAALDAVARLGRATGTERSRNPPRLRTMAGAPAERGYVAAVLFASALLAACGARHAEPREHRPRADAGAGDQR